MGDELIELLLERTYSTLSQNMIDIVEKLGLSEPRNEYQLGERDVLMMLSRVFAKLSKGEKE